MDQRLRAHSVLPIQPQQSRASTLLQKFSHLRLRLPLSTRKSKDARDIGHPYSSHFHSMDGVKPYMSQPLLGLANVRVESSSAEGDDGYSQSSPSASEWRRSSGETPCPRLTTRDAKPPIDQADIMPTQLNIDGLPANTDAHSPPHFLRTFDQPSTAENRRPTTPTIVITNESSNAPSSEPPHSSNDKLSRSTTPITTLSPVQTLVRKLSRKRLKGNVDTDGLAQTLPTPSPASPAPAPTRPAMATSNTFPPMSGPVEGPHSTFPLVRRDTVPPPRLTLPTYSHRFSLILSDGTSARFSPSVVVRPPSHPFLTLPTLPTVTAASPASSREGLTGLQNMPELPQSGSDPVGEDGDGGDDVEGETEFDDDERDGNSSTLIFSDDRSRRPSISSIESGCLRPESSTSRSRTSWSSDQEAYFTPLPGPDTSRIDLSFVNKNLPSLSDRKGKAKATYAHEGGHDDYRTPTCASPYRDYFNSQGQHREHEVGRTRVPPREDSLGNSLPRTPKSDDTLSQRLRLPSRVSMRGDLFTALQPAARPGIYKHASRSMIDFHAIETKERVEQIIREEVQAVAGEEKRWSAMHRRIVDEPGTPVKENEEGEVPVNEAEAAPVAGDRPSKRMSRVPSYEPLGHALRRRRSMPTFTEASDPPPYPSFSRIAGLRTDLQIQPRDDEGRERLPEYSNHIYIRAVIPRKMEFMAAGVQAKDRKWKKVLCVLEGTALKIYRPPGATGVSAIGEWWERRVGVGDVTDSYAAGTVRKEGGVAGGCDDSGGRKMKLDDADGHEGPGQTDLVLRIPSRSATPNSSRQSVTNQTSTSSRFTFNMLRPSRTHTRSISDAQACPPPRLQTPRPSLNIPTSSDGDPPSPSSRSRTPEAGMMLDIPTASFASSGSTAVSSARSKGSAACKEPDPRDLIRTYTMQHAESGLGNDYLKRKNVIRVRVEGEQFLLQAKDTADVVAWIEALQASANIALDLDERPMPKGPLFPRRRRGRPRRPATTTTEVERGAEPSGRTTLLGHAAASLMMVTDGFM